MKVLLFACLLGLLPAWSHCQTRCNTNEMQSCHTRCESCYSQCTGTSGSRCCVLELPNNPDNDTYPLGFQELTLPGSDDNNIPDPCLRVEYTEDEVNSTTNVNYLILAVETDNTQICMQSNMNNNPVCGSNAVYFCRIVPVTMTERNVDVRMFCEGSCEVNGSPFFIRAVKKTLQNDDEHFCDNNANTDNIPLPSSLNVAMDITQPERMDAPTSHAHPVAISQAVLFLTLIASLLIYSF